jgi:hypothetical protein
VGSLAITAQGSDSRPIGYPLSSKAECPDGGTATAWSIPAAGIHPRFSVFFWLTNACVPRHQFCGPPPAVDSSHARTHPTECVTFRAIDQERVRLSRGYESKSGKVGYHR